MREALRAGKLLTLITVSKSMFDFENLNVYHEARGLHKEIRQYLKDHKAIDPYIRDQLQRASISIVLNIAEGSGKFTKPDKKRFYIIARGSTYECVSILDLMSDAGVINNDQKKVFYQRLESVSKMLFGLIKNLE